MTFAFWIDNCEKDRTGTDFFGSCLQGVCLNNEFGFEHKGKVYVLSEEKKYEIDLEIAVAHTYDRGYGLRTGASNLTIEKCLITDMADVNIVYNNIIYFYAKERYVDLFARKGSYPVAVCVPNKWFGIIYYKKRGFLKNKKSYKLIAFSNNSKVKVNDCEVFAPSVNHSETRNDDFYILGNIKQDVPELYRPKTKPGPFSRKTGA